MNAQLSIWDKLARVVIFLLLLAGLLGVAVWYTPLIKHNERLRKEKLELDRQIEAEVEAARKLESATKSLQDPRTVERLAREKLSYAKPGEVVIHFEAPRTNTTTRTP